MNNAARRQTIKKSQGSGAQERAPEPRFLAVGHIVGAHGLHGELKVELLTDDPHRFSRLEQVFLGRQRAEPAARSLEGYRLHKGRALLKIEGCEDRATAQALRGYVVQVPFAEAIPLDEGAYFEHQILGLEVWTSTGELLGEITEIIYTGANEVYVTRSSEPGGREILVPAIADVVLEVDLEAGRLVVELPEGLL